MMTDDLAQWADDFEAFQARFAHFFGRSEPRRQAVKYLRGLMSPAQRKNGWQLAVNSRPNCTTHDRPMYTTHSRVDVYQRASVAAV